MEEIRREFEVNYFGHLNTIRAVLPYMKAQGGGVIHNVSSTVGFSGFPGLSGYTSTKGALEALSRTLALELEPYGIAVNVIHPPLTRTDSSAPLGVPARVMADPEVVGRKLAPKIVSSTCGDAGMGGERRGLHGPVAPGRHGPPREPGR